MPVVAGLVGSQIHAQLDRHFAGLPCDLAQEQPLLWERYQDVIAPFDGARGYSEWACHVPVQDFWLTGRLDRLYVQDQSIQLLDWKTGSAPPTAATEFQLDYYACLLWLAREALQVPNLASVQARAVYLQEPAFDLDRSYTATDLQKLVARFEALGQELLNTQRAEVPRPRYLNESVWCTMCEYQPLCPEGTLHA